MLVVLGDDYLLWTTRFRFQNSGCPEISPMKNVMVAEEEASLLRPAHKRRLALDREAGDRQIDGTVEIQAPKFCHSVLPDDDLRVVVPGLEVQEAFLHSTAKVDLDVVLSRLLVVFDGLQLRDVPKRCFQIRDRVAQDPLRIDAGRKLSYTQLRRRVNLLRDGGVMRRGITRARVRILHAIIFRQDILEGAGKALEREKSCVVTIFANTAFKQAA